MTKVIGDIIVYVETIKHNGHKVVKCSNGYKSVFIGWTNKEIFDEITYRIKTNTLN